MMVVTLTIPLLAPSALADPLRIASVSDVPRDRGSLTGVDVFLNHLEDRYRVDLEHINAGDPQAGLMALDECDVVFFHPQGAVADVHVDRLLALLENGPPLVALRGAAHALGEASAFDRKVLGARYLGAYDDELTTRTRPTAEGGNHPVFDGVSPILSRQPLFRFEDFAGDVVPLMIGATPGSSRQTITWSRQAGERRIFYTSLGGGMDFENDSVKRFLANALFWSARKEAQTIALPDLPELDRKQGDLTVPLRSRKQNPDESGSPWSESVEPVTLPVDVSALVIANLHDTHWCPTAAAQMDALADRANALAAIARDAGMIIVHAPSQIHGFYDQHPARRRIEQLAALTVEGNYPIAATKMRDVELPPMPLANANCPGGGNSYTAWTRQHPAIGIADTDIISGIGQQLYSYLLASGVDTLFYVGTHANTTLIDRNYGMRQMTEWGMDCILVRDLTDIMYDPAGAPDVPHDVALQMVIEHLEKHLVTTITSQELTEALGGVKDPAAGIPAECESVISAQ